MGGNTERGEGMMPKRIQRRRTRGWRKPEGAVCMTWPGVFGNPFRLAHERKHRMRLFRLFMRRRWADLKREGCNAFDIFVLQIRRAAIEKRLPELRGKVLCCWCKLTDPCHGDILLEWANAKPRKGKRCQS